MPTQTESTTIEIASDINRQPRERTGSVLLLETVDVSEQTPPIVLDQATTHICISQSANVPFGRLTIHRNGMGWNLRAHDATCELNGVQVDDAWLRDGDRVHVAGTTFLVRPATTAELLGQLPRPSDSPSSPDGSRPAQGTTVATTRERELAEWEACLAECESDQDLRAAWIQQSSQVPPTSAGGNGATAFPPELQQLRRNPADIAADRARVQQWLTTLRQERAALQAERDRTIADEAQRQSPEKASIGSYPTASVQAAGASECPTRPENPAPQRVEPVGSVLDTDEGPIGMEWHQPQRDREASRVRLNTLHAAANRSARQSVSRHRWKHQRPVVLLKALLVGMSFALASLLLGQSGANDSSTEALVWGAAAIGLITLSGLVHTWSEVARLDTRFPAPATTPPKISPPAIAEVESAELVPGI